MLRPSVQNETVKINEFSASECLRVFEFVCVRLGVCVHVQMHQTMKSKRESENTRANYVNTNCNEMKCNFSSFSADGTLLSSNEQNGSATISRAHQTSAHTQERHRPA